MCLNAGEQKQRRQLWRCGQEEKPGSSWDGAASSAVLSFPTVATTVFTALVSRCPEAPQTWWPEACPTLWLPPTSPEAAAAPQPFLVSSLSLRHTELCLCLGSSRSYSAMQRTCALEKNLDKKSHPMTFFSSVCSNKKSTCSAWSPQLLMSSPDFELGLYCIILVHLF